MLHYIYYQRITEGPDYTIGQFRISGTRIRGYFLEPGGPSHHKRHVANRCDWNLQTTSANDEGVLLDSRADAVS